ncbi:MAG: prepilin-type N-terminal cleavage/methylation domain-containing protein [Bacteroidota bacterium]
MRRTFAHLPATWRDESGFSIIEVLVALALLLVVLVPLSGFGLKLMGEHHNERQIEALQLARQEMERTILDESYRDVERTTSDERWTIRKNVERHGELVHVQVSVARQPADTALVQLQTLRRAR